MNREIYLDNNATTKPLEEVRDAMVAALGVRFGNPSSSHAAGDRGRDSLRNSRHHVGRLIGADEDSIIFTSSGTEANNMVLMSAAKGTRSRSCRIVTTSTEHSSVLKTVEYLAHQGVDVTAVPVGSDGLIDLEQLEREIKPDTSLVSVQWINNETGIIQPIESIGQICRARGVMFHIFLLTPRIHDEMIVRKEPSPVVVNARKKSLLGILERHGQIEFGIDENFPDKPICRTVLLHPGLCRKDRNGRWGYASPRAVECNELLHQSTFLPTRLRSNANCCGRPRHRHYGS